MTNATSTQLQELYVAYFGRAADPTGLDYWVEKGISTAAFAADMYAAPEFKSVYGSLTTEAQVNQIYKNLFDRAADVTGLTYWTKEINLGNLKLAEIATHLIWAAQNNEGSSDDKSALANRSAAAIAYTAEVRLTTDGILAYAPLYDGKGTEDFSAGDNITAAKSYMAGIDKDTAYTAAGITSSVNTIKSNGVPADTSSTNVALTTGTDFKTLTASNDTINASGATLGSDDVLTDLGGTDTLKVSVSSTTATSTILNSTGVEVIQVTNTGSADQTFELTSATGITTLSSYLSTGNVVFNDAQANAKVVLDNQSGTFTAEFANPVVVGSADVANIEIKNNASASVINIGDTDDEFETINIAVGDGKNTITEIEDGASADLTETSKIVITGSGQLTLGETALKDASEIDGSAATGKLLITPDETVDKLTGGSGDDTFTLTPGDFGSSKAAKTVDGGAGTDTVEFAADLSAAAFTAKDSGTHSISAETAKYSDQTIAINGGAPLTPSLDVAGITGVSKVTAVLSNADTDGDETITFEVTGLPADGTVDVSSTEFGTLTTDQGVNFVKLSLENASGTADAITLDADGTISLVEMVATADDTSTVGITETGDIETLTISSSDTTTAGVAKTLTINSLKSDDVTKFNVVGSNAITISSLDIVGGSANNAGVSATDQATNVIEFDASTSTGAVSITTTEASNLTIKGGSGKLDVDLGSTGPTSSTTITDVITGGSGTSDTVTIHDSNSAGTIYYPNLTGVEILQVETITSGATVINLKNTTGVETVQIIDEVTGAGFGTTVSEINGQTVEILTHAAATTTDFSAQAIVLNTATGVTNTDLKFTNELTSKLNDAAPLDGAVFSTNSGAFTITDAATDNNATSSKDDFENQVYEVAGTASTAKLTSLTISGGGDTDTTTAKIDPNKHTITASTNVNIDTVDASGLVADLDLVAAALKSGASISLGDASTTTTVKSDDLVADEVKFTDAGGTDTLAAVAVGITGATAIRVNSSGIETFDFELEEVGNGAEAAVTIDLRDSVGVTTLDLAVEAAATGTAAERSENVTVSNLPSGSKLIITGADTDGSSLSATTTVDAAISGSTDVTLTNSGAATALTIADLDFGTTYTTVTIEQEADKNIILTDVAGTKITTLNIGGANSVSGTAIASAEIDAKTVTVGEATAMSIDSNAGAIKVGTTALAAAKLTTLDIVGDNAVSFGGAASSVTTALADVNGSTATGAITFGASVDFATTSDITTGTADDSITLSLTTNTKTALDMGEKASDSDDLILTGTVNLGATNIDLTAADQITQINGVADPSVQTGIENVDLSAVLGSQGAVISGNDEANTITGSRNGDVITGGGAVDTINGKGGADTITITDTAADTTAKADVIQIAETEGGDVITGFDVSNDILDLSIGFKDLNAAAAVDLATFGTGGKKIAANNFHTLDNLTLTSSTSISATADVVLEIPSGTAVTSEVSVAAFLTKFKTGATDITTKANDKGEFLFVAYDGTGTDADAGLYLVDYAGKADTTKTIGAEDTVTLIAHLVDVGANNVDIGFLQ
jgi:hypothetical protein